MKLVICDNQRMLAEALATALTACGHRVLAVTTTAADGVDAVNDCRPDVCLLSLQFGDQPSGLDAARTIRQRYPGTKVLLLSGVTDSETLCQVVGSGVAGFIRKDQSVDQIASALDVVAAGGSVLDPGLPRVRARGRSSPKPRNPLDELSPREKEIVARIARGQSARQISVRHEYHGRHGPHLRKECARQSRGTQPTAACRPCQPRRIARRSGTCLGCSGSSRCADGLVS